MSAGSFSIYDLNPEIKKLLNADNFLNGLSVNDFVEEISKDHILKGAEVNKKAYLDPKPYIRSFESTIRELNRLSADANDQRIRGEKQVDTYELKHSQNVLELSNSIDKTTDKFNHLDIKISDVSRKINPLGVTLNKISTSRDKSRETIFLIRAYHGFYTKGEYAPLENLRSSSKLDDNIECARYIKKLIHLSRRISDESISSTLKCLQMVESYGERMEEDLLKKFEIASDGDEMSGGNFDIRMMNNVSRILYEYNQGVTLMNRFVDKNELSVEASHDEATLNENEWEQWSDPNATNYDLTPHLNEFLENIKFNIKSKARLSKKIFNNPETVIVLFIERIYQTAIKRKVTSLLQLSLQRSLLAHVRILQALYGIIGEFTNQIKDYMVTEEFDTDQKVSQTLEQSNDDLFEEYISDNSYLAREKRNLKEVVNSILNTLDPDTFNEQTSDDFSVARSDTLKYSQQSRTYDHTRFSAERKKLAQFTQYVKAKINEKARSDQGVSKLELEEDDLKAIDSVETLLKTAAESIGRALELAPNEAAEHSLDVLAILIVNFEKLIVREELQLQSLNFFWTLNSIQFKKEILFCLTACAKKIIFPCVTNDPIAKGKARFLINEFVKVQETSINELLNSIVDYSLTQIRGFLGKQKKKDFLCDSIEDDTEACELISEFLNEMYANISVALTGDNLLNTLLMIGNEFLKLLLEHYKKFSVNSIGGVVLTKDAIRYQTIIDEWGIPELSEKFQILKEIGNLFTVSSELVNSLVTEGQLSRMKPYNVRQYISKRADFNPSYADKFFKFR
ncbi:Sec10 protein [Candida orthopsilosis Co 90-125]|uniref:Sec10 protein n=1 Tax=Candida orthopsilosis (strain 90-125) TaxID=1136231 RepID=H8WZ74_CANO9|nr:Sec10 protein [Candida orthopsilosis Co 90-125]CCG21742.1 Sec10 protein [Candida orthopsilosis Co 90-125]